MWLFYYFNFERNYDVLKSKSPCILLNKNINFSKNETESKMENPTHSFREANLVLQFIQESQFKNQNCDELELAKEKTGHFFLYRLFCTKKILLTFVFYFNIQNIHTLHIKKHYFIHLFASF